MAKEKTCSAKSQLEENGVVLDCKWAFNPVSVYKPNRRKLKQFLTDLDGMQACNRFRFLGAPEYFPVSRIEQMLYFRSALVFFKQGKEFRILPFVPIGNLNLYGFLNKVQPIAYNGGAIDEKKTINFGQQIEINQYEERDKTKGVILFDRQNAFVYSNGTLPSYVLQETIINEIINRLSFLNINLVNSQGKNIILVKDPKQKNSVEKALNNIYSSDKAYALVKSMFEVQVINNGIEYKEQELWEDIMSWNNLRLERLGIDNNGLFNKKERQLTIESSTNEEQTEVITDAYYEARKEFVRKVNEVFGDDPDFKEQFKNFRVIDLRVENKKEIKKEESGEEEDGDTLF